jgi:hypothetical protein
MIKRESARATHSLVRRSPRTITNSFGRSSPFRRVGTPAALPISGLKYAQLVLGFPPETFGRRAFGGLFLPNPLARLARRSAAFRSEERIMNSLMEVMPARSSVSRGKLLEQLFKIGFLTAIAVAMVGWTSAIGWLTVKLAMWLMA